MSIQRPSYDMTGLGYLTNLSMKKPEIRLDPKEKDKLDHKIESSQSFDKPKEVGQDEVVEILDEPKQVESPKKTKYDLEVSVFYVMK